MKTIKWIAKFIREHRLWIRIFAILNLIGIALAVFYALAGLSDEEEWLEFYYMTHIISVSVIFGIIGSIALWLVTTKLIKYLPLIIILYIPCIILSQTATLIIYTIFNDTDNMIICYILRGILCFVDIFILLSFCFDPAKKLAK